MRPDRRGEHFPHPFEKVRDITRLYMDRYSVMARVNRLPLLYPYMRIGIWIICKGTSTGTRRWDVKEIGGDWDKPKQDNKLIR